MRKHVLVLLTFLASMMMISCQKELSLENGDYSATGALKMKIDGVQWVGDKVAAAAIEGGYITITGLSTDNKALLIQLEAGGLATYTLDLQSVNYATVTDGTTVYATDEGQNTTDAGGTVTVTEIDTVNKTISGTFSFIVYNNAAGTKLTISEGSFTKLPYTGTGDTGLGGSTGGGDDPTNPDDSFTAKVNGTTITPTTLSVSIVNGYITITAIEDASASSNVILLAMPDDIAPGTYQYEDAADDITGTYSQTSLYQAQTGVLTITEHNTATKFIKGTFSFQAKDAFGGLNTADITEGAFGVTYQ